MPIRFIAKRSERHSIPGMDPREPSHDCSRLAVNRIGMKRTYYELFKSMATQEMGNDPDVWEAWFKTHPNLVWDDKQKRLVEPKPVTSPP